MDRPDLQLVETSPLPYLLSVPSTPLPASGFRPVLCFLHGYDEAAPTEIRRGLTRHGPLSEGSSPDAWNEFVVVAPQLPVAGDVWQRYADSVGQIVRQVQSLYQGDLQRSYLTGFSFGGNGVLDLALLQPNLWAALWAVDPTRVPREDPQLPIWLSAGEVSRRNTAGFIARLSLQSAELGLEGKRVLLDQGQDHVGSATLAYRDERIYQWLLSQHRPDLGA